MNIWLGNIWIESFFFSSPCLVQFGGDRPGSECCQLWHSAASPLLNMDHWGKAEDKRLLELARVHGNRNWEKIAAELQVCVRGDLYCTWCPSLLLSFFTISPPSLLPSPSHTPPLTLFLLLFYPLKTNRSPVQCLLRYQTFLNFEIHKGLVTGVRSVEAEGM